MNLDSGRIILRNTKNTREIPITWARDAVELLRSDPRTEGNPYDFTGTHPSGKRSDRQVEIIPRQIRDATGLPKSFDPNHVWRINLATQGRQLGVDTFYIQKMGGWESPAMVDHNPKVNETTLRNAVEIMAGVLGGEDCEGRGERVGRILGGTAPLIPAPGGFLAPPPRTKIEEMKAGIPKIIYTEISGEKPIGK